MAERKAKARLVAEIDVEIVSAGMREWDAQHRAGTRDWPTMFMAVFAAMKAVEAARPTPNPTPETGSVELPASEEI